METSPRISTAGRDLKLETQSTSDLTGGGEVAR